MPGLLLHAVVIALLAGPGAPAQGFPAMSRAAIDAFLKRLDQEEGDPVRRFVRVSSMFLGVPYAHSPLGEGAGNHPDPDPLINFARVDCTTFIEQTMALSQASNLEEAMDWLRRIRYKDGRVDYRQRKHFMMAQWIPLNQKAGFLSDITRRVGGSVVRPVTKRLDGSVWERRRKKKRWPKLAPGQVPVGVFRLPVIPIGSARELAGRIPAGTILNVVRKNYRSIPVRISHQGIVVVRRKRRYLRHAARAGYGRVVDELLDTFLRRNQAYRKWPVEGINLQRVGKFPTGQKPGENRLE